MRQPALRDQIEALDPCRQLPDALPCPFDRTLELANTPTRLKRMDAALQEGLVNWGYAVCDAALRRHVDPAIPKAAGFPYPGRGV